MKERYKSPIAVYIILRDYNKRILLIFLPKGENEQANYN